MSVLKAMETNSKKNKPARADCARKTEHQLLLPTDHHSSLLEIIRVYPIKWDSDLYIFVP